MRRSTAAREKGRDRSNEGTPSTAKRTAISSVILCLSEDGAALSIGAPLHNSIDFNSGQVKVYKWDKAALDYVQIGVTLNGVASDDQFGSSLDISNGKILTVGANGSDAKGSNSGQVTIYEWDEVSSNFKQRGGAISGDAAEDRLGYSASLAENGQKLAVGATGNDSNGSGPGQVRIFEWDEATSNCKQLGDSLLGDVAGDMSRWSVSFSRNGRTLAIGAPGNNNQNGLYSGQVKVLSAKASMAEQTLIASVVRWRPPRRTKLWPLEQTNLALANRVT